MFLTNGLLFVLPSSAWRSCRGSCCWCACSPSRAWWWRASGSGGSPTGPTCTCATASARRCRGSRRASPGCGSSRPSAARSRVVQRFGDHNRALRRRHMRSAPRLACSTCRSIEFAGRAHHRAGGRRRRLLVHRGRRHHRHRDRVLPAGSPTCSSPIQQLSQLFNMVQSAGRRAPEAVRAARHPVDGPSDAGAVDLAPSGDIEVDGVTFSYGGRPAAGAARRQPASSPPASGWPWSGPPARASRRWPSWWPASTTPPRARCASAASTCGEATLASLRRAHRRRAPGGLPVPRHHPRQRAPRAPGARPTTRWPPPCAPSGPRALRRAARRAGHRGQRARVAPVGGREAARVPGPGRPGRPGACWCSTRPPPASTRAPSSWSRGGRGADGRADRGRDRPPAVDRRAGRPGRRGRRRAASSSSAPTTSWWRGAGATRSCSPPGPAGWVRPRPRRPDAGGRGGDGSRPDLPPALRGRGGVVGDVVGRLGPLEHRLHRHPARAPHPQPDRAVRVGAPTHRPWPGTRGAAACPPTGPCTSARSVGCRSPARAGGRGRTRCRARGAAAVPGPSVDWKRSTKRPRGQWVSVSSPLVVVYQIPESSHWYATFPVATRKRCSRTSTA